MKKIFLLLIAFVFASASQITPMDFSKLKEKMPKFNGELLDIHLKLYEGYVREVNFIDEKINKTSDSFMNQSLRKQYAFEYDGMKLHELYFSQLGGNGDVKGSETIISKITDQYAAVENFVLEVKSYAKTRGIGWVILFGNISDGDLKLTWIQDHERGFLSGWVPLAVIDLWEHAYISQFGLNKDSYVDLCFEYMDWSVINKRYTEGCKCTKLSYKKYTKKNSEVSHLKSKEKRKENSHAH